MAAVYKTINYSDGVYEGYVVDGKRHGKGKFTWKIGDVYDGYWYSDKRTGKGKYTWANGTVYEGDFVDGKITGKGMFTDKYGVYEGDWFDGKKTGKGKYTWADGEFYEGDFVDGKLHGKGKYTWANGDVYNGDWFDDKRTGKGKITWADGDVYEGDFVDGKITGFGKKTYTDGRFEEGCFVDGELVEAGDAKSSENEAEKPASKESDFKPYSGNKPYIFISYSHKDYEAVMSVASYINSLGYRLWYDEGIDPGTEWDDNIATHVEACGMMLAFMSPNYISSENCKDELNYARDLNKGRVLIYIEPTTLPSGMAMRLNRLQAIHKYKYSDLNDFYNKIFDIPDIEKYKD